MLIREKHNREAPRLRVPAPMALLAIAGLLSSGCRTVPVQEQRLVSKPNMVFEDYGAFIYESGIVSQTEPGTNVSGGAQAAGCTSCR